MEKERLLQDDQDIVSALHVEAKESAYPRLPITVLGVGALLLLLSTSLNCTLLARQQRNSHEVSGHGQSIGPG